MCLGESELSRNVTCTLVCESTDVSTKFRNYVSFPYKCLEGGDGVKYNEFETTTQCLVIRGRRKVYGRDKQNSVCRLS